MTLALSGPTFHLNLFSLLLPNVNSFVFDKLQGAAQEVARGHSTATVIGSETRVCREQIWNIWSGLVEYSVTFYS